MRRAAPLVSAAPPFPPAAPCRTLLRRPARAGGGAGALRAAARTVRPGRARPRGDPLGGEPGAAVPPRGGAGSAARPRTPSCQPTVRGSRGVVVEEDEAGLMLKGVQCLPEG